MHTVNRILIVDDDEDDFILAEAFLLGIHNANFEIVWAGTYMQAQALLRDEHFDLCFFDYMLGADTGLDLLMEVRALHLKMPIIFLTGKVNPDLDRYLIGQGVADYLEKSELDTKKLERAIRYALERTAAINALQASEEKYRTIFEASTDGICLLDANGQIQFANASTAKLLATPLEQLQQQPLQKWLTHEQDAAKLFSHITNNQPLTDWEIELTAADSDTRICILSLTSFPSDASQKVVSQCVLHDVTKRKKMEMDVWRAEKLAATSRFMRMLGHEIRNPLNNIDLAAAQIDSSEDQEETRFFLDIILRNSNRISELLTALLRSTDEGQLLNLQPVLLGHLLDKVQALAQDRLDLHKVIFQRNNTHLESIEVLLDLDKLAIALLNIVVNAIEVLEEGGRIETSLHETADELCVAIRDNGHGIPEQEVDHIFEPYYSRKNNGMGLGLASTLSIVNGHKGRIEVISVVGVGTTFQIFLPRISTHIHN